MAKQRKIKARIITPNEADLIRERGKRKSLTRPVIAKQLGVGAVAYDNYLGGKRKLPITMGIKLYHILGQPTELIFLTDSTQYTLAYDYKQLMTNLRTREKYESGEVVKLKFIRPNPQASQPRIEAFRAVAKKMVSNYRDADANEVSELVKRLLDSFPEYENKIRANMLRAVIKNIYDSYCDNTPEQRAKIISRLEHLCRGGS